MNNYTTLQQLSVNNYTQLYTVITIYNKNYNKLYTVINKARLARQTYTKLGSGGEPVPCKTKAFIIICYL